MRTTKVKQIGLMAALMWVWAGNMAGAAAVRMDFETSGDYANNFRHLSGRRRFSLLIW